MPRIFLIEGIISFKHSLYLPAASKAEAAAKFRSNYNTERFIRKSVVVEQISKIEEVKD